MTWKSEAVIQKIGKQGIQATVDSTQDITEKNQTTAAPRQA